jgi:hypothetical protein
MCSGMCMYLAVYMLISAFVDAVGLPVKRSSSRGIRLDNLVKMCVVNRIRGGKQGNESMIRVQAAINTIC